MINYKNEILSFLEKEECDYILFTDSVECRYITGIDSSNITILLGNEQTVVFTDFRYKEIVSDWCKANDVTFHQIKKSLSEELKEYIEENTIVAVQSDLLSVDTFNELQSTLINTEFKLKGKEIASIFSRKIDEHLLYIKRAAHIADESLTIWKRELFLGITEFEAAKLLNQICERNGSEKPSFETIVLFGKNSSLPHGKPGDRELTDGDIVLVDFGCTINGFCSDMTRTFFINSANEELKKKYEVTLKAQLTGLNTVKSSVEASEVDNDVRSIIEAAGFGELFGHGTGHGVGLRIHEYPSLNKRDNTILKPNMVVTVEPGIYTPNLGGIRIEDLVIVTEKGCKIVSQSPKELEIVNL